MQVKSDEEFHRIRIILKGGKKIKIKKYEKVNQNACKKRHKRVKYTELKNVKELTLTKRLGCRQAVRLRTLTPSSGSSNLSTPAKNKENSRICLCGCFSLCPRWGREFSSRIVENFLFNCPGVTRFAKHIYTFCRAKRYSVACSLQISPPQPNKKEQASACFFCFSCEAVKERFKLRATPPGGKTVLRTVFSDDRRYLQSIGLNFRICFANIKRKISPPWPQVIALEPAKTPQSPVAMWFKP